MEKGYCAPGDTMELLEEEDVVSVLPVDLDAQETATKVRLINDADSSEMDRGTAFTYIYNEYKHVVFAIVLRRVRNRAVAEDLTQEVFVHVRRKIYQIRDPERFAGWIKQMAVRIAVNHAVRDKKFIEFSQGNIDADDARHSTISFSSVEPIQSTIIEEQHLVLRRAMSFLNANDAQILRDFYMDGLSIKEIMKTRGLTEGTVKRRLFTARHRLHDKMMTLFPQHSDDITERFIVE